MKKAKESGKKESAAVDLQQASIHACAASTAGKKAALILYGETGDNQREQSAGDEGEAF